MAVFPTPKGTMDPEGPLPPALLQRVQRDFEEFPTLRVTPAQAQRRWNLDGATCRAVLVALEEAGVVQRGDKGQFACRKPVA